MVWVLVLVVWVGLLAVWLTAIVDALRRAVDAYEREGRARNSTVLLVVLTGWFGAVYYLFAIRPALLRAEHRLRSRQQGARSPVQPGQRCTDCGLSSISITESRCKNCGSERLERLGASGEA